MIVVVVDGCKVVAPSMLSQEHVVRCQGNTVISASGEFKSTQNTSFLFRLQNQQRTIKEITIHLAQSATGAISLIPHFNPRDINVQLASGPKTKAKTSPPRNVQYRIRV